MRFAVLGTGIVGRTLAGKLDSLGHNVVIGTRTPESTLSKSESDFLGNPPFAEWFAGQSSVLLVTFAEAAAFGEIIVNTTSGMASLDALGSADADDLNGKIIIDVANPLDFSAGMPPTLNPVNVDSLGEQIQRAYPGAKVVKTLNTVNSRIMVDPSRIAGEHDVFVAGDDIEAKKTVTDVLLSFGWPAASILDLGGIRAARGTEMTLALSMPLMGLLGHADFNFRIQGARS